MIFADYAEYTQKDGKRWQRLEAYGHAGYAAKGSDIVCAGASILMETLLYQLADCDQAESCAYHEPTGPRIAVTMTGDPEPEAQAALEFTKTGLALLTERYPAFVRFEDRSRNGQEKMVDLQLFAEGGDGAGDGAPAAEAAKAAPELPKLRPAEERLARRSGVLKRTATENRSAQEQPAGNALPSDGQTEPPETGKVKEAPERRTDAREENEEQESPDEEKSMSPEEHRKAFGALMQGEYHEEFTELMQRSLEEASRRIRQDPAMQGLLNALAETYGTDPNDLTALTEAVKSGKVKDEAYYEKKAMEQGVSVATARQMDKLESENKRLSAAEQFAEQQRRAAEEQARMASIHAQWDREAEALKSEFPEFDLGQALDNPEVSDMMRRGVSLTNAYRAACFDEIMARQKEQTAKTVEQGVMARQQQRSSRPAENGTNPGGAVQARMDVAHMSRREMEALEKRVARGEIITL